MDSRRLLDSLALLNSQLTLDTLLPAVLDEILAMTHAGRAFVMLKGADEELKMRLARGRGKVDLSAEEFQGSRTIVKKTLTQKQCVYIPHLASKTEYGEIESVRRMSLKSAICIPLIEPNSPENKASGVIYVDSSSPADSLTEDDVELLKALANHVSISLHNANLFDELQLRNKEVADLNGRLQQKVEVQQGSIAEMEALLAETQRELGKTYKLENLVGKSPAMLSVFRVLEKVVRTNATVLVLGESGTGKELVARYLHYNGPRFEKPMVSINCSAFSDTLLESELFGHKKGAFTGATEHKIGLFQTADGGTLFLDEVGDMSPEMQRKLLRSLQEGEVRPIGSRESQKVDVRIIAATNKNLKAMTADGRFREDLYYRLNVIRIEMPPLRERREDIPLLVKHFSEKLMEELEADSLPEVPGSMMRKFMSYSWPGNVRELENELRKFFILESEYKSEELTDSAAVEPDDNDGFSTLASIERRALIQALEAASGNKTLAARMLGLPRRTFYEKLSRHKIR